MTAQPASLSSNILRYSDPHLGVVVKPASGSRGDASEGGNAPRMLPAHQRSGFYTGIFAYEIPMALLICLEKAAIEHVRGMAEKIKKSRGMSDYPSPEDMATLLHSVELWNFKALDSELSRLREIEPEFETLLYKSTQIYARHFYQDYNPKFIVQVTMNHARLTDHVKQFYTSLAGCPLAHYPKDFMSPDRTGDRRMVLMDCIRETMLKCVVPRAKVEYLPKTATLSQPPTTAPPPPLPPLPVPFASQPPYNQYQPQTPSHNQYQPQPLNVETQHQLQQQSAMPLHNPATGQQQSQPQLQPTNVGAALPENAALLSQLQALQSQIAQLQQEQRVSKGDDTVSDSSTFTSTTSSSTTPSVSSGFSKTGVPPAFIAQDNYFGFDFSGEDEGFDGWSSHHRSSTSASSDSSAAGSNGTLVSKNPWSQPLQRRQIHDIKDMDNKIDKYTLQHQQQHHHQHHPNAGNHTSSTGNYSTHRDAYSSRVQRPTQPPMQPKIPSDALIGEVHDKRPSVVGSRYAEKQFNQYHKRQPSPRTSPSLAKAPQPPPQQHQPQSQSLAQNSANLPLPLNYNPAFPNTNNISNRRSSLNTQSHVETSRNNPAAIASVGSKNNVNPQNTGTRTGSLVNNTVANNASSNNINANNNDGGRNYSGNRNNVSTGNQTIPYQNPTAAVSQAATDMNINNKNGGQRTTNVSGSKPIAMRVTNLPPLQDTRSMSSSESASMSQQHNFNNGAGIAATAFLPPPLQEDPNGMHLHQDVAYGQDGYDNDNYYYYSGETAEDNLVG